MGGLELGYGLIIVDIATIDPRTRAFQQELSKHTKVHYCRKVAEEDVLVIVVEKAYKDIYQMVEETFPECCELDSAKITDELSIYIFSNI